MRRVFFLLYLTVVILVTNGQHHYAIHSRLSASDVADLVEQEGGRFHRHIKPLNVYHVSLPEIPESSVFNEFSSKRVKRSVKIRLHEHPHVRMVYQDAQRIEKRARNPYAHKPTWNDDFLRYRVLGKKPKKMKLLSDERYEKRYLHLANVMQKRVPFNDPASKYAWQYLNTGNYSSGVIGFDLNIYPLYVHGYSGNGSNAVILDDGLDTLHDDLKENYDPNISGNINDPKPWDHSPRGPYRIMRSDDNHGTMCAGLIAAVANNNLCSHGIAFKSRIGAVRLLAGPVNDIVEASSMLVNAEETDMYCASWGPTDDGLTMDQPRNFTIQALRHDDQLGRHGRGTLFLFASGNGGINGDNCGADGFVSSPYVIAISALDANSETTIYSESCAAIRVAVPVGSIHISLLGQSDLLPSVTENNQCVESFVGTSAAAPLAAGCFAIALEARPELLKRDIENLLPWSARLPNPSDRDWLVNGAGIFFSSHAGYGLLDCTRLVFLARSWIPVGPLCIKTVTVGTSQPRQWARFQDRIPGVKPYFQVDNEEQLREFRDGLLKFKNENPLAIPLYANSTAEIPLLPNGKSGQKPETADQCVIEVIEKVVVHYQLSHICRGALSLQLRSPSGTVSNLLYPRRRDQYTGQISLNVTSVAQWGEEFDGNPWHLLVTTNEPCPNEFLKPLKGLVGMVAFVELTVHGTTKLDSAFERNKLAIEPYLSRVGKMAMNERKSHVLSEAEVVETFDEQRWLALEHSEALVKMKFPEDFEK